MPDTNLDDHSSLTASVEVVPGGPVHGVIRPPGSKSLTNRALICAAFARGRSRLNGALHSEDTEVMIDALRSIGVQVDVSDGGRTLVVDSSTRASLGSSADENSPHVSACDLFIANSGTSIRFLTAALSAAGGRFRLWGVPRMHERPIGDLVDAIAPVIDGTIKTTSPGGCPPVEISSRGWDGHEVTVAGNVSSQFLSGLMMAAPIESSSVTQLSSEPTSATSDSLQGSEATRVRISVSGDLVSRPYVDMTAQVMRSFGATVHLRDADLPAGQTLAVDVDRQGYQATDYAIEPDASAASYFWATAAITQGEITVEGLTPNAMQGDVGFCEAVKQMGCHVDYLADSITVRGNPLHGIDIDMNQISDTVQTLAVVALFADGPTRVRGVAHNRFKETDRIGDLACELRKLGAKIDEHEDGLTIHPPADLSDLHGATLETYHDHRMAMSLSLAGLRIPGVRILDPACTAKTYPEFFCDFEKLIGRSHHWGSR